MTIKAVIKNEKLQWRVSFSDGGVERRKFFPTEAKAKKFAATIDRPEGEWEAVSPKDRRDLLNVRDYARAKGERAMVLLHQGEMAIQRLAQIETSVKTRVDREASVTLERARAAYMLEKTTTGLRPATIWQCRHVTEKFIISSELPKGDQTLCSDVTGDHIGKYLNSNNWSARSIINTRTVLGGFFNLMKRKKWIKENPINDVVPPKDAKKRPGIVTPEDMEKVLRLCESYDPTLVTYFVLAGFLGIRPAECERMSQGDVHLDQGYVYVPPQAAKTGGDRYVKIMPNALAWLKKGWTLPVENRNYRQLVVRKLVGERTANWCADALRHSFGSYHLALQKDNGETTARQMGHIGTAVLWAKYHNLVLPDVAERFFAIMPS